MFIYKYRWSFQLPSCTSVHPQERREGQETKILLNVPPLSRLRRNISVGRCERARASLVGKHVLDTSTHGNVKSTNNTNGVPAVVCVCARAKGPCFPFESLHRQASRKRGESAAPPAFSRVSFLHRQGRSLPGVVSATARPWPSLGGRSPDAKAAVSCWGGRPAPRGTAGWQRTRRTIPSGAANASGGRLGSAEAPAYVSPGGGFESPPRRPRNTKLELIDPTPPITIPDDDTMHPQRRGRSIGYSRSHGKDSSDGGLLRAPCNRYFGYTSQDSAGAYTRGLSLVWHVKSPQFDFDGSRGLE